MRRRAQSASARRRSADSRPPNSRHSRRIARRVSTHRSAIAENSSLSELQLTRQAPIGCTPSNFPTTLLFSKPRGCVTFYLIRTLDSLVVKLGARYWFFLCLIWTVSRTHVFPTNPPKKCKKCLVVVRFRTCAFETQPSALPTALTRYVAF